MWHTPETYDVAETTRLLVRTMEAGKRLQAMADTLVSPWRARNQPKRQKDLRRKHRDYQQALALLDRAIPHMESVRHAVGIAQTFQSRYEQGEDTLDRAQFYEQAMTQQMPDKFDVVLRRDPDQPTDQHSFTVEGVENVGYQLYDFILARIVAHTAREGRAPNTLRAELRLVWDDDEGVTDDQRVEQSWTPWYAATDKKGGEPIPVDGKVRLSTFLTDRRERLHGNNDS